MSAPGLLGVSHRELAGLLAPLRHPAQEPDEAGSRPAPSSDELERVFARAALSTITEPGETDAGRLVTALGPAEALRTLVRDESAETVRDRIRESHPAADPVDVRRLSDALSRWRDRLAPARAVHALEMARHVGAALLTPEDPGWPPGFAALGAGEPLTLWTRGDQLRLRALDRSLALVGARAASGYGEHVAMESAAGLSDRGFAIVSGGAYGIDGAVHRATLASSGVTVAFLAGGVDRLYPAGHSELLKRVGAAGVLAAELPCGSAPTRWRFLMRNRLIAAAASATVVIEAGSRSGSLNTAGHSAEIGRPLGAVPGPVTSPASAGCHRLIREYGATCVTTVDEMAELAEPLGSRHEPGEMEPADGRVRSALLTKRGRLPHEIEASTGLPGSAVRAALGRLEAAGSVAEHEDGWRSTAERQPG